MASASKYAFIVAATGTYTPELCALLNSLDYVGNKNDVHVIGIELPQALVEQFGKLGYEVIFHPIGEEEWQREGGRSEIVCRKRYWYAAEYGKEYDAVCVLDADLIFCRNPQQYFEIAEKTGFILGPGKEQNKVYEDKHHQFEGQWLIPKGYYNFYDLCNCPVFLSAKIWSDALRDSWKWFISGFPFTNAKAPDMDLMNIAFIKHGGENKIIVLPGVQWLGTNEQMLKPYLRVIDDHGLLKTECGIPIFSFHGQYYYKAWRENQLLNRHNCASGYLKADKHEEVIGHLDNQARGAMNTLHSFFRRMLDYKIIIEKKHWRHPELAYEE